MKTSDLINVLQEKLDTNGDLDVYVASEFLGHPKVFVETKKGHMGGDDLILVVSVTN